MNQPPQGGYPPQPQGAYQQRPAAYPQQPGQYPQAPQAYPPQYPGGAPYPGKRGPSKGVGVLKVLIGLCLSFSFAAGLASTGHEGIAMGVIFGLLMGVGLRWIATGGANVLGKKIPLLPSLGVIVLGGVIGGAAGGPLSDAYWGAQEQSTWDDLNSRTVGYIDGWEWDFDYFNKIPEKYHRPEARGTQKLHEVQYDIRENNLVELRQHISDIKTNHADDMQYFQPALDAASSELQKKYDEVLAKLSKDAWQHTKAEFELDEKLREAFKQVLTDLSGAATPDIYLAFSNTARLEKPEGSDEDVESWWKNEPSVQNAFEKGKVKVIDPGKAFSTEFDFARRSSFVEVTSEAFRSVFDANLLTLKPLENGEGRDKKIVLEVSSTIVRVPEHFNNYNTDAAGNETSKGLLFGIVVDWSLKLFDRSGALIYEKETRSAPANDIRIGPGEMPDWGVYSILMDSAYFNYSREVIGSFGLAPPEVKGYFSYRDYGVKGN
ncbi:MAG: hypothetical protein H6841_06085 [Planctomycetes bacterium]|nr:hypothetical protein [Planctomycetota bacterium]